jgi:hypothetical protein
VELTDVGFIDHGLETILPIVLEGKQRGIGRGEIAHVDVLHRDDALHGRSQFGVAEHDLRVGDLGFGLFDAGFDLAAFGLHGLHHFLGLRSLGRRRLLFGRGLVEDLLADGLFVREPLVSLKRRAGQFALGIRGRLRGFGGANGLRGFLHRPLRFLQAALGFPELRRDVAIVDVGKRRARLYTIAFLDVDGSDVSDDYALNGSHRLGSHGPHGFIHRVNGGLLNYFHLGLHAGRAIPGGTPLVTRGRTAA